MDGAKREVACFKKRSTSSIPHRSGAIQCVRNCTNCFKKPSTSTNEPELEALVQIKSYQNLHIYKPIPFSSQSLQYHPGQIDIVRQSFESSPNSKIVYIVGSTKIKDARLLNFVLEHANLQPAKMIDKSTAAHVVEILFKMSPIAIPVQLITNSIDKHEKVMQANEHCLETSMLWDIVDSLIKLAKAGIRIFLVPVSMSKDHDEARFLRVGSLCILIQEPYSLLEYTNIHANRKYITNNLVQHLDYDLAQHSVALPSHLVAFLLLYLEREDGVNTKDLVKYVDWFREQSMDVGLQIGFTGESKHVVDFGLLALKDLISSYSGNYRAVRVDKLSKYARLVVIPIVYYCVVARSILIEHCNQDTQSCRATYSPEIRVRVRKDKVIDTCVELAKILDKTIPCRPPCVDIKTKVECVLMQMHQFGHYYKFEEPKARPKTRATSWMDQFENSDDDNEYFQDKKDNPALQTWILVTQRDYRLDRLNLLSNAIDSYIEF